MQTIINTLVSAFNNAKQQQAHFNAIRSEFATNYVNQMQTNSLGHLPVLDNFKLLAPEGGYTLQVNNASVNFPEGAIITDKVFENKLIAVSQGLFTKSVTKEINITPEIAKQIKALKLDQHYAKLSFSRAKVVGDNTVVTLKVKSPYIAIANAI